MCEMKVGNIGFVLRWLLLLTIMTLFIKDLKQ
jgi:hypothetical protein